MYHYTIIFIVLEVKKREYISPATENSAVKVSTNVLFSLKM